MTKSLRILETFSFAISPFDWSKPFFQTTRILSTVCPSENNNYKTFIWLFQKNKKNLKTLFFVWVGRGAGYFHLISPPKDSIGRKYKVEGKNERCRFFDLNFVFHFMKGILYNLQQSFSLSQMRVFGLVLISTINKKLWRQRHVFAWFLVFEIFSVLHFYVKYTTFWMFNFN